MLIEESLQREKRLKDTLLELSKEIFDEDKISKVTTDLMSIYTGGFRHSYANIFPLVNYIIKNDHIYSLDILTENLNNISIYIESFYKDGTNEYNNLHKPLMKLKDHLLLEIARSSYYAASEHKIRSLVQKNSDLQNKLNESITKFDETKDKIDNIQKEYIGILGIFSAVVLSFMAEIAFSSSVLQNMHSSSIYRVLVVIFAIGLVTINLIYFLFKFIIKMTKNDNYKSNMKDSTLFMINIILILLMVSVVAFWRFGYVENRNTVIQNQITAEQNVETINEC